MTRPGGERDARRRIERGCAAGLALDGPMTTHSGSWNYDSERPWPQLRRWTSESGIWRQHATFSLRPPPSARFVCHRLCLRRCRPAERAVIRFVAPLTLLKPPRRPPSPATRFPSIISIACPPLPAPRHDPRAASRLMPPINARNQAELQAQRTKVRCCRSARPL